MEQDGNNASSVDANLLPSRLSHIEVLKRRVAPSSIVVWESEIRRAEISGSDSDGGAFDAPSWVCFVIAYDSVAFTT